MQLYAAELSRTFSNFKQEFIKFLLLGACILCFHAMVPKLSPTNT
jgi:hypothetical protein